MAESSSAETVNAEARCMCKDRAATMCPGEWEPGCDLGNNSDHVRVHQQTPEEREAMNTALGLRACPDDCHKKVPNTTLALAEHAQEAISNVVR